MMNNKPIRILVIDDHYIVFRGLEWMIKTAFIRSAIDGARSISEAMVLLEKQCFDLVILDIKLPDSNAFTTFEFLKSKFPDLAILVFSMYSEKIFARRYLKLGAKGYLSKVANDDLIRKAIGDILKGDVFKTSALKEQLATDKLHGEIKDPIDRLSNREIEVMLMLVNGFSQRQIGDSLNINVSTVATYKTRILEKLELDGIVGLQQFALIHDML